MALRPDEGDVSAGDYVDVDVDSLAEAGVLLADMAKRLQDWTDAAIAGAVDVLDGLPSSDLHSAYAFCWGRWSPVMDSAHEAVDACGTVARQTAAGYREVDRRFAGQ